MKKFILIASTCMLIALTALVAVACGGSNSKNDNVVNPNTPSGNSNTANSLVGTWKIAIDKDYELVTLNANQQGTWLSYSDYYKETYITPLSWSYDDATKRLIVIFNDEEYGYNTMLTYEVMWFGNNQVYLKWVDGMNYLGYLYEEVLGPFNRQ